MEVRDGRVARLRRAARGRPLALVTLLYAVAALVATWPAVRSFGSAFIANDGGGGGEPPAGDHLQSVYRFWLVGHQLEQGESPWKDPYSFQPLVEPQTVLGGWPFGLPFWPVEAAFGPVVAWNLLLLGTIVAAGLLTYGWLRALALPAGPAVLGGLAFALAPYRLAQSAGHLLGWTAVFLPLALLALERARVAKGARAHGWGALAALATVSIPLSGQLHLALGAVPFLVAYAAVRFGRVPFFWTLGGAAAAVGIGLAVRYTLIAGSAEEGGRSSEELRRYSAEPLDFLDRWHEPASEEFVYLGWLLLGLGIAGLIFLAAARRGLAILLGVALVVPLLLALGATLPGYEALWRNFPPLHFTRVPERLLPIATLALAALAAFACASIAARSGRRATPVLAGLVVLLALDLAVLPFSAAAADPANRAYRALEERSPGRILELPIFGPGQHYASVYDYYRLQEPREHPTGYSTLAPREASSFYFQYNRLSCGVWLPEDREALARLGINRIVLHEGLYVQAHRRGREFARHGLHEAGWRPRASDGPVSLWELGAPGPPTPSAPPPGEPVLCTGWRGRTTMVRLATIWVYGQGRIRLDVSSEKAISVHLVEHGRLLDQAWVTGEAVLEARLRERAWHPLVLDTSEAGLRLEDISF